MAIGIVAIWGGGNRLPAETNAPLYSFDVWQTEQGLPQNSVTSIVQTRDGYLWLGTYNGLVRFDGVRFKVFDSSNTPEFQGSRITSLFEDEGGSLWIGHETGNLTRLRNGNFSQVDSGTNSDGGQILSIASDGEGSVWTINYYGRLFSEREGKSFISPVRAGREDSVPSLVKDKDGKLWVVHGDLTGSLEKGILVPMQQPGEPDPDGVQRVCASRNGGLWIVGDTKLRRWNGGKVSVDAEPVPWGQNALTAMLETKAGELLIGTLKAGLFLRSREGTYQQFTRSNGLSHDWVRCLYQDREGTIWVGTGGGGLDALRSRKVTMVKAPDDWLGRAVLSVTPSAAGGLWVGTEGAGLYRLNEGNLTRFEQPNGLPNSFVWSVLEDRQHGLWVGTWGGGLVVRRGETFQVPAGLEGNTSAMLAMHQDRRGALWIGTQS
ncbi:MAG: hypothetical protein JWR69_3801, partial [Pedosphaera sp.]|nr:hypothetical protein [Pedosphaera sp.]